jgi:hypothetical protein
MPWERRPTWEYLPHLGDSRTIVAVPQPSSSTPSTASTLHAGGGSTHQAAAAAAIRGQRKVPGQTVARASIQRSLDDHAERVAAKRARIGEANDTISLTAAQRLEAVRCRLRARLGAESSTAAAGASSPATATAAAAAASHVAWHTAATRTTPM